MAALDISEIIDLVPASKLTSSRVYAEESEFDIAKFQALFNQPLEFPTLDQAILSEDTVCIPVEPGIPDDHTIAANVARAVVDLGVDPSQITILLDEGSTESRVQSFSQALRERSCENCMVQVHHAAEPECLGYLGPSQSGEPITLNARLVHADFVLPIARAKPFGWKSQADFLYPYFSDLESQKLFFKLNSRTRLSLNQEVHRWLGNCFLVSIAARWDLQPGSGRRIIGQATLGENEAVKKASRHYLESICSASDQSDDANSRYDLVIANLNAFLCLFIEELEEVINELKEHCSSEGSIVLIWNDDSHVPTWVDRQDSAAAILNDRETKDRSDLESGNLETVELGQRKIFLCSEQPLLQQLGLSTIQNLGELQKLIDAHDSVLVLPDFINDYSNHRQKAVKDPSAGAIV